MPTTNCYAIYDRKAMAYGPPVFFQSTGLAQRALQDLLMDGNTTISRYPGDFFLSYLGVVDLETGRFDCPAMPEFVCDATALLPRHPNGSGPVPNSVESVPVRPNGSADAGAAVEA